MLRVAVPSATDRAPRDGPAWGALMSAHEMSAALRDLIGGVVPTMDHVAVLLAARAADPQTCSPADYTHATRLDRAVVTRVSAELAGARVLERAGDGYRYAPPAALRPAIEELAEMYHTKPVTLVRAIYDRPAPAVQSFADAFRLRKGET